MLCIVLVVICKHNSCYMLLHICLHLSASYSPQVRGINFYTSHAQPAQVPCITKRIRQRCVRSGGLEQEVNNCGSSLSLARYSLVCS